MIVGRSESCYIRHCINTKYISRRRDEKCGYLGTGALSLSGGEDSICLPPQDMNALLEAVILGQTPALCSQALNKGQYKPVSLQRSPQQARPQGELASLQAGRLYLEKADGLIIMALTHTNSTQTYLSDLCFDSCTAPGCSALANVFVYKR